MELHGAYGQPVLAVAFFVSYVLVGSLAMLPMFIGTISLAMGASITELNAEILAEKQERVRQDVERRMEKMQAKRQLARATSQNKLGADGVVAADDGDVDDEASLSVSDANKQRKLKSMLLTMMEGKDYPFVEKLEKTSFRRSLVSTRSLL